METGLTPAPAVKAERIRLGSHMTLEDAFQCIGLSCLRQVEANLPGVLRKDVESLHQMRVGLRRLRALADMFAHLAAPPAAIRDSLDSLSVELGAARDWDVLAGSTLDHAGDDIHGIDLAALRTAAQDKAKGAHQGLLHTLHAPRTAVLLELGGWLQGRQWRSDGILPEGSALAGRARRGMRPLLRKAEQRLARRVGKLDPQDAPARHRVRIAAKKARYAAEFFRDLLPRKRAKRYIARLAELQGRLGTLNDFAVADRLLDGLAAGHGEAPRQAAWARGYLSAIGEAESRRLGKPLRRVAQAHLLR